MDLATSALLGFVGVIALNELIMRVGVLRAQPVLFWSLQVINMGIASYLILLGLPGFEDRPMAGWVIALLLVFRMMRNNTVRAQIARRRREEAREERKARAEALTAALDAGAQERSDEA